MKFLEEIKKENNDSTVIDLTTKLYYRYININNPKVEELTALGLQYVSQNNDSINIAQIENLRGLSIMNQGSYFMALQIFFRNYEIFSKYNLKKDLANTLLYIAKVYIMQEIPDIASEKILHAITYYRSVGDSISVGISYRMLGQTYIDSDNSKALEYLYYSKKILQEFKEKFQVGLTNLQIAKVYLNVGETERAINQITYALTFFKDNKNDYETAEAYLMLGEIYLSDTLFSKANSYFYLAKNIFKKYDITKKIAETDIKIGTSAFIQKNYFLALKYADTALYNSLLLYDNYLLSQSYKLLSDSYGKINNIQKAYFYNNLYAKTLKAYYEEKNKGNFSAFQMNLETQNKENELVMVKMKAEKDKLELAHKQYQRNIFFAVIIFILILLYLVVIFYKTRERKKIAQNLQKANEMLVQEINERKRTEIESQRNEKRYKLLFSQTPIGILQFDENLHITDVNERFSEIFHKDSKDIINSHINTIFDRNTITEIAHLFESTEDKILTTYSEIPTKKDVLYVSVTIKKYRIWNKDEEFLGGIIIVEDFTEHKRAERYYKANILSKQKLLKQLPDDLILLDTDENIIEIHFPDFPEREIAVSKLSDIFKDHTLTLFRTHLISAHKNKKTSQFIFNDGANNFLVRIISMNEVNLIIISRLIGEAQDAGIILTEHSSSGNVNKDSYLINIQNEIEKDLLPIYQNIQRGLSFIMIKNFAEKIVSIGKKYNNNKIIEYGEQLIDQLTSFNIFKVNEILDKFPTFISQFMGISSKF